MLRIGCITFDNSTNYGSCLQAYALKTATEKCCTGEECCYDVIPYTLIRRKQERQRKKLSGKIKHRIWNFLKEARHYKFSAFERKNIHYADCKRKTDLPELNEKYDAFVCGSDVIWKFSITQADPTFFLDFAKKHKFSYAASFGHTDLSVSKGLLPEPPETIYSKYLPQLDNISVREKSAVQLAEGFAGKPVEYVCDPVFLLTAEEWEGQTRFLKKGKYIFAYSTHTTQNYLNFINRLKAQTGLPVVCVTWTIRDMIRQKAMYFPRPEEWLGLLRNAEYVVTNSFHATAFSVIFHRKFFTVVTGNKQKGINVRMYDFLKDLGLDHRMYTECPAEMDTQEINYSDTDEKLARFREKSLNYLQHNLEEAARKRDAKE